MNPNDIVAVADPMTILAQILDRVPEVRIEVRKGPPGTWLVVDIRTSGASRTPYHASLMLNLRDVHQQHVDPIAHGLDRVLRQTHARVVG